MTKQEHQDSSPREPVPVPPFPSHVSLPTRLPCDSGAPSLGEGELSDRPLWGQGSERFPTLSCGARVRDVVEGKGKQVSEPFAVRQTIDSGGRRMFNNNGSQQAHPQHHYPPCLLFMMNNSQERPPLL